MKLPAPTKERHGNPTQIRLIYSVLILVTALAISARAEERELPNILWIVSEDNGPHLGVYGDRFATTPHLDALARRSMIFERAWSNAPVCAPARTAIITARHPVADGAEHMRSSVPAPVGHRLFPQFLQDLGYYCANNGKEDYNVIKPEGVWDESSGQAHYANRRNGEPFFAVFNIGITHEGQLRDPDPEFFHDPDKVPIPPYHPDGPSARSNWTQYYDKMTEMDRAVGALLAELEERGEADNTIIFYYGDHGPGMPRGKRWPYDSGLRVPLLVYFPPAFAHLAPPDYRPGGASDRLVSFVDLGPTVLSLAGIAPPGYFHGRAFAGEYAKAEPKYIFGYRGRMDERYDFMRTVSDGRYVYLRHYLPHLPFAQHVSTMFRNQTMQAWQDAAEQGQLTEAQSHFWKPKPVEELYDLWTDPWESRNLLSYGDHPAASRLRAAEREQFLRIGDLGLIPEAERMRIAQGQSPRDATEDWRRDHFRSAYQLARRASDLTQLASEPFAAALYHDDAVHRYWGVIGLRTRGQHAVREHRKVLQSTLSDPSPSVRIAAAEALATFGNQRETKEAIETLVSLSNSDQHGLFVALEALLAIDGLDAKALPHRETIASLPQLAQDVEPRVRTYAGRVIRKILQDFEQMEK